MKKISIVPKPEKIVKKRGDFLLSSRTCVKAADDFVSAAGILRGEIAKFAESSDKKAGNTVTIEQNTSLPDEGYELNITPKKIHLAASAPSGAVYGVQTLLQLMDPEVFSEEASGLEPCSIPCLKITDAPKFGWRGMHLDAARHFMPLEFIKKYIDLLAMHKMNVFHWHLTEDQGWRIEIKKYPKLTEVGAYRKETIEGHLGEAESSGKVVMDGIKHGGFYTQDEIREVVEYAAERFVTVVPEIDMPGHMQAAIASYPELGCTGKQLEVMTKWGVSENILNPEDSTVQVMKDILSEVMELFPSPFIHIGGDEVPKKQWEESQRIQKLRKERGLKDMREMQSWFIRQMDDFLTNCGRRLIGWDEILEGGLARYAAVMSWRGPEGAVKAAAMGHEAVMADNDYTYFDYYQGPEETEPLAIGGNLPIEKVYEFNPVPESINAEAAEYILGGQGQVWTEYMKTPEHVEYMAFPRVCALTESLWTADSERSFSEFKERLQEHLKRLDAMKVNYRKLN